MTEKTIKELIEEARELGIDVRDHVAKEMFGAVTMETRRQAKQMAFRALYSASPDNHKQTEGRAAHRADSGCPRKMTEEQIKARVPLEFKQMWMNEPFKQYDDCPVVDMPQSEGRMTRVGVVPFEVEVLDDGTAGKCTTYTVHATSALDARCMAFVLDGGCQIGLKHWDDGHIELALAYTEVVG